MENSVIPRMDLQALFAYLQKFKLRLNMENNFVTDRHAEAVLISRDTNNVLITDFFNFKHLLESIVYFMMRGATPERKIIMAATLKNQIKVCVKGLALVEKAAFERKTMDELYLVLRGSFAN